MTDVRWIGPLGVPTISLQPPSVLMVGGCPGAGKSEMLSHAGLPSNATVLEADRFRGEEQLRRGGSYDDFDSAVIPAARERFLAAIEEGLEGEDPIIVDAALLDVEDRRELVELALAADRIAHLIVIDAKFEQCRAAQSRRTRRVPDDALRDYSERWRALRRALTAPVFEEPGLSTVTVVDHAGARRIGRIES